MLRTNKQMVGGVALSYISQALQIIVTLFYTPVILRLLGKSEYGLYQLAYSVVSYLSLFSFGFSSAYIKFYTSSKVKDNPEKEIAKLNGMFLSVFCGLGLLAFTVGAFLSVNTDAVLGGKLTSAELDTSRILMWIIVTNSALHFPLTVFNNYIIAKEKFVCLNFFNLIGIILNPIMTFPMILMGYKSISLAVVLLAITLIKLIGSVVYCFKVLKIRFIFSDMQFSLLKSVSSFSFFIFLEIIITMVNVSLDRFLLGKMVGSVSVAIYSVGGQINTLYSSLSTSISSVFTPKINKMVTEKHGNKSLSDLFIQVGKIQYVVLLLVLSGFIVFGKRFILLWAGEDYGNAFWVALVLIVPNTINLIQNIAYEIQRAKGMQKYRSMIYSVIAVMNVFISIFLIKQYNEVGAAIGTGIAWVIGSGIFMNWFYSKKVGLDIKRFWKEIAFISKGVIPLMVSGLLLHNVINGCNLLTYIVLIVVYSLLYVASMITIGLSKADRNIILTYVKKFIKR